MNSLLGVAAYGPLGFMGYSGAMGQLSEEDKRVTVMKILDGSMYQTLNGYKRKIMENAGRIGAMRLQANAMSDIGARQQANAALDSAFSENSNARAEYERARVAYNEVADRLRSYINFTPEFMGLRKYAPSSLSGLGQISETLVTVIVGTVVVGAAALALSVLAESVAKIFGYNQNSESFMESGRKIIEAGSRLPSEFGKGALDFGKGLHEASTGLMQLAVAAAIGYGIYLLVKKGRRSAGATAPTTALALPDLKTVEGTVIS